VFHTDVAKAYQDVAYVAIIVHVYILQASIPNVSSIFSEVCCKCVYLDVAKMCCKCFIYMLRMFAMILQVFQTHVSSVSSVFFLYVASVASRCFKNRSGCWMGCNDVSSVCPKYFICFRRMLQMFHLDVAKVDLDCTCCSGTHLSQPPACSYWSRACVWERGGRKRQARKTEGCRSRWSPRVGACMHRKRSGMGPT
jgi:hypothetical protein